MNLSQKRVRAIFLAALLASGLAIYFVFSQLFGLRSLNEYWTKTSRNNLDNAIQLAIIEGSLGYAGFIHHFQNYVIRRSEPYHELAEQSYAETRQAIGKLKTISPDAEDRSTIAVLEKTLEEYYDKMQAIHESPLDISASELDRRIKVNDQAAESALAHLRENILDRLIAQQTVIDQEFTTLQRKQIVLVAILTTIFLLASLFASIFIRRIVSSSDETNTIFETLLDGILYIDHEGRIIRSNEAFRKIFGYEDHELRGMTVEDLLPGEIREQHRMIRSEFLSKEQSRPMISRDANIQGVRKDGTLIDLAVSIASRTIQGETRGVCVVQDRTKFNKLVEAAEKDHLTSVYNRRSFDKLLENELARQAREKGWMTVMMIDIDHFKAVNDTQGHAAGDLAIKQVAQFLLSHIRGYDYLCRWGGDEFALLCPNLPTEDAIKQAERIRQAFEQTSMSQDHNLTLSIGVTSASDNNPASAERLLAEADKAVYQAKGGGRNRVCHYQLDAIDGLL